METECVSGVVAYPRVGWGGPGDSACDGGSCEFLRCQFVGIVACAGNTVPAWSLSDNSHTAVMESWTKYVLFIHWILCFR